MLIDLILPRHCPVCGQVLPFSGRGFTENDHGERRLAYKGQKNRGNAERLRRREPCESRRIFAHKECLNLLTAAEGNICQICGKILGGIDISTSIRDTGLSLKESEWISNLPICRDCRTHTRAFTQGRSLWLQDRFMSRSLYEFKYKNEREYADLYAEELYRRYGAMLRTWKVTALVPVPIHLKRRQVRGYNQAELIADKLSQRSGIPMCTSWLLRSRDTKAQKDMRRFERRRNLAQAFYCPESAHIRGSVCLIDDIFTTGSTLEVCAEALLQAGAERVYFLTVTTGEDS